jgi:hypothetical protein
MSILTDTTVPSSRIRRVEFEKFQSAKLSDYTMSRAASHLPYNIDTGSLTAVAVLLVAVYFLTPPSIQAALAFDHGQFAPHTLLTAAYVHGSDSHLYNNLIGYAIAALYTYALCLSVDERQWFRRKFSVQLLVIPILVNLVSYTVFQLQCPEADPSPGASPASSVAS